MTSRTNRKVALGDKFYRIFFKLSLQLFVLIIALCANNNSKPLGSNTHWLLARLLARFLVCSRIKVVVFSSEVSYLFITRFSWKREEILLRVAEQSRGNYIKWRERSRKRFQYLYLSLNGTFGSYDWRIWNENWSKVSRLFYFRQMVERSCDKWLKRSFGIGNRFDVDSTLTFIEKVQIFSSRRRFSLNFSSIFLAPQVGKLLSLYIQKTFNVEQIFSLKSNCSSKNSFSGHRYQIQYRLTQMFSHSDLIKFWSHFLSQLAIENRKKKKFFLANENLVIKAFVYRLIVVDADIL